jgi:hypothetical protein
VMNLSRQTLSLRQSHARNVTIYLNQVSMMKMTLHVHVCLVKKEASRSGYKKHSETAYLTVLADCKKADNEKAVIHLKEIELEVKTNEQERADAEKAACLELELKLEEKRFSSQE